MKATLFPLPIPLSGELCIKGSKSCTQRAYALSLLNAPAITRLYGASQSADDQVALRIIQTMGAQLKHYPDYTEIYSKGMHFPAEKELIIDAGASGLSARMFAPIAALLGRSFTLTGSGSLCRRSFQSFHEILPALGLQVQSENGFLPLCIRGKLNATSFSYLHQDSTQLLTGLLFALSAMERKEDIFIEADDLVSRPYIALSLHLLSAFGIKITHEHYEKLHLPKESKWQAKNRIVRIEADWSGAAFFIVMATLYGAMQLYPLSLSDMQGDKAIVAVCRQAGADITEHGNSLYVRSASHLRPFHYDASDTPDLFPPLVSLASACQGRSAIKGIRRLYNKESNRLHSLVDIFSQLGVKIYHKEDTLFIEGGQYNNKEFLTLSAYDDHRIAMAIAVAALGRTYPTEITDASCVEKSYPSFWEDCQQLGIPLRLS